MIKLRWLVSYFEELALNPPLRPSAGTMSALFDRIDRSGHGRISLRELSAATHQAEETVRGHLRLNESAGWLGRTEGRGYVLSSPESRSET